ncbi:MAG: hypothetical protein ABFR50_10035 [Candidatus Fermentibacteria bacterium]
MKHNGRIQNRVIPQTLGILIAAGLLPLDAAADQSEGQIGSVTTGDSTASLSPSLFTRTSALWSCPQWQEFKRLWKKLDSIGPADGNYTSSALAYEEYDKIRIELDGSQTELIYISDEIGIDSLDIVLLHRLALNRLDMLSYGSVMPFTRMMPPPVSEQTDYLLSRIEAGIDTVALLKKEGLISTREMITAFANLRSSIDTYFLLETISHGSTYTGALWSIEWPLETDRILPFLDSTRTAILNDLRDLGEDKGEQYAELLEEFEIIEQSICIVQNRLSCLHGLLIDLEFSTPR